MIKLNNNKNEAENDEEKLSRSQLINVVDNNTHIEFKIANIEFKEKPLYLIEKVDVIYLSIKNESKFYHMMKLILIISAIISYSWMWSFLFMFSTNRQNIYCFNPRIAQFDLCSRIQVCQKIQGTIPIIIYDDTNLSNVEDQSDELYKVSQKYQNFFSEITFQIFSNFKPNIDLGQKNEFYSKLNLAVILSDREHVNIHMKYGDLCNYKTSLIIFGTFVFSGTILGNIFLSVCSDIFGRKKLLSLGIFLCSIFSLSFFTLSAVIDSQIQNIKNNFLLNERINFPADYVDILQQYYFTIQAQNIFKDNKIIFAILLFFIHFFNSSISHSSLSLLIENSLNDRLVYKNFWLYNNGIIISIFYFYLLSFPFNDFKIYYLISGILLLILFYIIVKKFHESPRLNFEYSEWNDYTEFFKRTNKKDCEILKQFYINEAIFENVKDFENRLLTERKEEVKESIMKSSKRGSVYDLIEENYKQFRKSLKRDRELIITRDDVKKNPFLIIAFLLYDKKIRRNNPIIWAFIIIVFFIFSMISLSFFSRYFYTRDGLFNIYILNSSFFHISLVFLFSNFFFYLIVPFFGFKKVIIFSFLAIFILGLIINLPMTDLSMCLGDLNRYNYYLTDIYLDEKHGTLLRCIIFLIGFFLYGIYYNTYMYLFRFTKTIYRSTFFGIVDCISKLVLFGSAVVSMYFMWYHLIVSIVSMIGVFTVIFLEDKEENNIITDKKRCVMNLYDR